MQIKTDLLSGRVSSQLTISQVKMNDSGEYLCLAENSAGQAKKTLLLTVQVTGINYPSSSLTRLDDQDVPSKITHMEVLDYTSRAATLSWTPPYDGQSPITSYNIRYKSYQGDTISYPTRIMSIFRQLARTSGRQGAGLWISHRSSLEWVAA